MTTVEKVARAMYTATMPNGGKSYEGFDADLDWEFNAKTYRQLARAAIQAIHDSAQTFEQEASHYVDKQGYTACSSACFFAVRGWCRAALDEKP